MLFRSRSRSPSLLHSCLSLIAWCGCLGALGVSALGLAAFLAPDVWMADNMSFFLRQFLAAGIAGSFAGALGLLLSHRMAWLYRLTFLAAVGSLVALAAFTGARTLANTGALSPVAAGETPVKVVSINLEHLFLGDSGLQAFLEREKPDIVVLQEVLWSFQERRWKRLGLEPGGAGAHGFPDYLKVGDLGGLAIYSRFPVLETDSRAIWGELPEGANVFYNSDREILTLTLDTGATPLHLVAIHPDSPRTEARWLNKRRYFDEVDKVIDGLSAAGDANILAIGDWNSAPWSARFQETLSRNGLKTVYPDGFPRTTRFFFDYSLHWILGAPVDQFAVSDHLPVADVSLGPDIGSDHLPLIVELGLPAAVN